MKPGTPNKPPAIRIWKETAHRGGKGVSAIQGIPLPGPALEEICSQLKKKCGTGGTVKNGVIEIQGDHRRQESRRLKGDIPHFLVTIVSIDRTPTRSADCYKKMRNVPITHYLPRTPPVSTMRIACSTDRSVSTTRLRGRYTVYPPIW